ncbi:MAG: hypothetical protein IID46_14425, partial [Planctomycetes bacterium]|nr:hypothetical protein [Planctomycetota bacterium]
MGRQAESQPSLTGGGVVGTPGYIAPEILLGDAYDGRADQYSLAVAVFEMLAGRRPFIGATPSVVIGKQIRDPAPDLCAISASVPASLGAIVMTALDRDPQRRFATCLSFAQAVEQTLAGVAAEPQQQRVARAGSSTAPPPIGKTTVDWNQRQSTNPSQSHATKPVIMPPPLSGPQPTPPGNKPFETAVPSEKETVHSSSSRSKSGPPPTPVQPIPPPVSTVPLTKPERRSRTPLILFWLTFLVGTAVTGVIVAWLTGYLPLDPNEKKNLTEAGKSDADRGSADKSTESKSFLARNSANGSERTSVSSPGKRPDKTNGKSQVGPKVKKSPVKIPQPVVKNPVKQPVVTAKKKGPSGKKPPIKPAVLVIRWPLAERKGATLAIDGTVRKIPGGSSAFEFPLPAGRHRVELRREGFRPIFLSALKLSAGRTETLTLNWIKLPPAAPPTLPKLKGLSAAIVAGMQWTGTEQEQGRQTKPFLLTFVEVRENGKYVRTVAQQGGDPSSLNPFMLAVHEGSVVVASNGYKTLVLQRKLGLQ